VPTVELFHPPASHRDAKKSLAGKRVGTVSGFFELSERSGGGGGGGAPSAKLVAMQTEIDAKAREIAQLRAQLGLPRGAAAKVRGDMAEIRGRYGGDTGRCGEVCGGNPNPTLVLTLTLTPHRSWRA